MGHRDRYDSVGLRDRAFIRHHSGLCLLRGPEFPKESNSSGLQWFNGQVYCSKTSITKGIHPAGRLSNVCHQATGIL